MADNTTIDLIQLKRTIKKQIDEQIKHLVLSDGEPLILKDDHCFTVGDGNTIIEQLPVAKMHTKSLEDNSVFYNTEQTTNNKSAYLVDDENNTILPHTNANNVSYNSSYEYEDNTVGKELSNINNTKANQTSVDNILNRLTEGTNVLASGLIATSNTEDTNLPILAYKNIGNKAYYNNGVYINCLSGRLFGAAWNDFAEWRLCSEQPGTVVCENGDGTLSKSKERLQPGAMVVSDTYGMIIGNISEVEKSKPICVAGRVLVNVDNKEDFVAGDAVCASHDGKIAKMTRTEIQEYPDRILGYVSEIPKYEKWNDIIVGNRIWINIK